MKKRKWLVEEIADPKLPDSLVNFRVPDQLKGQFDKVCKEQGRNRSSVLIGLMIGLIDEDSIRRERNNRIRRGMLDL